MYWTKKGVVRLGFLIKTPLTIKFRDWAEDYIINKQEVVKTPQIPKNYIEALEAHLLGIKKIAVMTPKVEAYDALTHQDKDTINDMTLGEVAKSLGWMPIKEFNPMLRKAGVIFNSSTEPKSEYIQKKWFRGTTVKNSKTNYTCTSWKITPLGVAGMIKKIGRKDMNN